MPGCVLARRRATWRFCFSAAYSATAIIRSTLLGKWWRIAPRLAPAVSVTTCKRGRAIAKLGQAIDGGFDQTFAHRGGALGMRAANSDDIVGDLGLCWALGRHRHSLVWRPSTFRPLGRGRWEICRTKSRRGRSIALSGHAALLPWRRQGSDVGDHVGALLRIGKGFHHQRARRKRGRRCKEGVEVRSATRSRRPRLQAIAVSGKRRDAGDRPADHPAQGRRDRYGVAAPAFCANRIRRRLPHRRQQRGIGQPARLPKLRSAPERCKTSNGKQARTFHAQCSPQPGLTPSVPT